MRIKQAINCSSRRLFLKVCSYTLLSFSAVSCNENERSRDTTTEENTQTTTDIDNDELAVSDADDQSNELHSITIDSNEITIDTTYITSDTL